MLLKTRGIVLHQFKYSESSLVLHIYTESHGRQSFIISGVRGKKSKQKASLFQPLFILELETYFKPSHEIHRIKGVSNHVPFSSLPFDVKKSTIALFLAELLYKTLKESESNPDLFHFLINAISILDETNDGISNFHLVFLLHYSRFLGFAPDNNQSNANPFFDLRNGYFTGNIVAKIHCLNKELSDWLAILLKIPMNFSGADFPLPNQIRSQMLDKLIEYYHLHLEGLGEFKSLEVFRELVKGLD